MNKYEFEKKRKPIILDSFEEIEQEQKKDKKKKSVSKIKTAVISRDQSLLTKFIKKKQ